MKKLTETLILLAIVVVTPNIYNLSVYYAKLSREQAVVATIDLNKVYEITNDLK